MTQTFSAYLLEEARDYFLRDAKPRVAWDQMAAKTWGDKCVQWAEACEGMTHAEGCAFLLAIRDRPSEATTGMKFMVGMDVWKEITRLVDPFTKDPQGWIKYRQHDGGASVSFTRYIGLNQPMSTIRKGKPIPYSTFGWNNEEDATAWTARKAAWFSRYAEDLPVLDDNVTPWDFTFYPILGRAGDFAKEA